MEIEALEAIYLDEYIAEGTEPTRFKILLVPNAGPIDADDNHGLLLPFYRTSSF